MDQQEAIDLLIDEVTRDRTHDDYIHVTDLADKYKKLITGKEIETLLKRFNPRESPEMFQQRTNLTIAITPAIAHSAMNPFFKVPRTEPLVAKFKAKEKGDESTVMEEMQDRFDNFYGSETGTNGVDYFLESRFMELTFMDPNAWLVVEFDPFDSDIEKARPRPFEVSSKQARNYSIVNNQVKWLRVDQDIFLKTKEGDDYTGKKHTMYADDFAIVFEQTLKEQREIELASNQSFIEIGEKLFIASTLDTKTKKVPAFRVGYKRDLETDGRTYVNPFHDAMCFFDKSIKQVSEYDIATALHTFPQKLVRLTKTCPGLPFDPNGICKNGQFVDGSTCTVCKGTGRPIHTSGQDIVEVELPENIKEEGYIPLTELVHYVELPIEVLTFQRDAVREITPDVHQAVFNTTVLVQKGNGEKVQVEKTATQQDDDIESVYDAINPFAKKFSATWMFFVEMIAIITDNDEKLTWQHRFPANFKLKTRHHLYNEYRSASEADLPAFVIDSVTDELAENIWMDDADALLKYRVKKKFFPFKGKNKQEISLLLNSDEVLKKTKILFNYFEEIFQILEDDYRKADGANNNFYLEKIEIQKEKIDAEVDKIAQALKEEQPKAFALPPIGGFGKPPGLDEPDDEEGKAA